MLYFNLATGAISTDPSVLQPLPASQPLVVTFGDDPELGVIFHNNGTLVVPDAPEIEFLVKKTGDYLGPAIVLCNSWTAPGSGQFAFTGQPNFTSEVLYKLLIPSAATVGPDVANQAARFAVTAVSNGYVVYQTDTSTLWVVVDNTNLANAAGWSSDVPILPLTTLAVVLIVRQGPNYGKQTSTPFTLQVTADYFDGNIVAPAGTLPFAAGLATNRFDIVDLVGGAAGDLDFIPTAGIQFLVGSLVAVNIPAPTPLWWRLTAAPAITATSVAMDTVVTTATPHNLSAGQSITIGGDTSSPSLNGNQTVLAVVDATHFTVAVNVTVAGTAGCATPATNAAGGLVRPIDFDPAANPVFWASRS